MFRNDLYYRLKPFLPHRLRMAMRRWHTRRLLPKVTEVWPINEGSQKPPPGWPGWPSGKQFALVLTHDVEGPAGLAKVKPLMELEQGLGFRSSFNFIPEGNYCVPADLRRLIFDLGFEVGVHDLHHDGKLYHSRNKFQGFAQKINAYLKDWGAVGFRSGFMHRQLAWLHDLNIQYDMSTFDTDPFEPQPNGANTIFPFWVPNESVARRMAQGEPGSRVPASGTAQRTQPGYVELPYTLPQDSTLFLLMEQKGNELWKAKLDWVAAHGGMALVNVHPDYMYLDGTSQNGALYPAAYYADLLKYVRERYHNQYWLTLPREVVGIVSRSR